MDFNSLPISFYNPLRSRPAIVFLVSLLLTLASCTPPPSSSESSNASPTTPQTNTQPGDVASSSPPSLPSPPGTAVTAPTAEISPPAATEQDDTTTLATITEIQHGPVFIRRKGAETEEEAQIGTTLNLADTIRTAGETMVQVEWSNGLGFRLGGDAVLTLAPSYRLQLDAGEMITWVEPGQTVPAEIITPTGAVAGIRGTTLFVDITNPGEVLFFSWEGTVAVRLAHQSESVLLESGEEVRCSAAIQNLAELRQQVRRLNRQDLVQRRRDSRLINRFDKTLPTLKLIETMEQIKPDSPPHLPNHPSHGNTP